MRNSFCAVFGVIFASFSTLSEGKYEEVVWMEVVEGEDGGKKCGWMKRKRV